MLCVTRVHFHVILAPIYVVLQNFCSYLEKVLDYLSDYLDRVHPLLDQNSLYEEIEKEFEDKWLQGNFPGWRVSSIL